MNNIHPTIAAALRPFFTVAVRTPNGERGCRIQAEDSHQATIAGLQLINLRDEEIPHCGITVKVKVSA